MIAKLISLISVTVMRFLRQSAIFRTSFHNHDCLRLVPQERVCAHELLWINEFPGTVLSVMKIFAYLCMQMFLCDCPSWKE